MADQFIRHNWEHNTEVIWNDDLSAPAEFIVNGRRMSPEEFQKDYELQTRQEIPYVETMMDHAMLLEDLFVAIQVLKARMLSRYC
jgi:hypothetical protein